MTTTRYIATDRGTTGIYGIGDTPDAAIADAVAQADPETADAGRFLACRATDELIAALESGAVFSWYLVNDAGHEVSLTYWAEHEIEQGRYTATLNR